MRPTRRQEEALEFMARARRFVYNWALERRINYFREHKKGMSRALLSSELTVLKKRSNTAWLKEADSQALQQALRDLNRAFDEFRASRSRFPRFRSANRDRATFRIPQRVRVEDGCIRIPKIGRVRIRQSQLIHGLGKGATFKRSPTGKWFVTLTAEFELPDLPLTKADPELVVGLDAGLTFLAVLSDGRKVSNPRWIRRSERKLARAQRELSRKVAGSRNRGKAKQKVARIHEKVVNQRRDHMHKITTRLIREVDVVCVEDLPLRNIARSWLSKSVQDAALGELRRQLEYKANWNRKRVVVIDRYFPSSRRCSVCGTVNRRLTISDREWTCVCGVQHDRDVNAAHNIRTEGLRLLVAAGHAETINACGVQVRPPDTGGAAR